MMRQLLYAIVTVLICLLVLEGIARIFESTLLADYQTEAIQPGWQTEFFGSLFDWHESDPDCLWRFKAGLDNPLIQTNSDHFLGPDIEKHKDRHGYRILLLGDSSPVGLGLSSRRQAFGEQLRYLLDKQMGASRRVELINAAVSGYTSEQIVALLNTRGWDYDPDLVVLYCGNNDASVSGILSDEEILAAQEFKSLRSTFSHLAIYRVLRGFLLDLKSSVEKAKGELKVRVSPDRFGRNLAEIAAQCQEHNCRLIILKPPVPYLWPAGLQFKPFIHLTGEGGQLLLPEPMIELLGRNVSYCLNHSRFSELYGEGDFFTQEVYGSVFVDSLTPGEAIEHYVELTRADSQNPLYLNNLGVAYWRNGQFNKADVFLKAARSTFEQKYGIINTPALMAALSPIYFNLGINTMATESPDSRVWYDTAGVAFFYLDSALQADYFSLRIKAAYYKEIDRMAKIPGVTILNLPVLFRKNGGEHLFLDHCHPTVAGHKLIARQIERVIMEDLQ